jgi:hypothetical protein
MRVAGEMKSQGGQGRRNRDEPVQGNRLVAFATALYS